MRKSSQTIKAEKDAHIMGLKIECIQLAIHTDSISPANVVRQAGDYFSYITGDIFHNLSGTIKATPIATLSKYQPDNGVTPVAKGKNKPKKEVKKPKKAKTTKSPVVLAK